MADHQVLILDEGAARLRIARTTLSDWGRAGKFHGLEVGREWRVLAGDVEQYLEEAITRRCRPVLVPDTEDERDVRPTR
jgi:predicted site-specific integrase-resolvase